QRVGTAAGAVHERAPADARAAGERNGRRPGTFAMPSARREWRLPSAVGILRSLGERSKCRRATSFRPERGASWSTLSCLNSPHRPCDSHSVCAAMMARPAGIRWLGCACGALVGSIGALGSGQPALSPPPDPHATRPVAPAVVHTSAPIRASATNPSLEPYRALLDRYCVTCHNDRVKTANLSLQALDLAKVAERPELWEKVIRKLRAGVMPPPDRPRPALAEYEGLRDFL